jgi:hypothetical protein
MMDTKTLVVGQDAYMLREGRFKSVKLTKIAPSGVETKTSCGSMRFDTNGKACDGSGWELTLEHPDDKCFPQSASEHAGELLLETFGIGAVTPEFQLIWDQVTAEHPDWTMGNRLEEAEKRKASNQAQRAS